MRERQNIMSRKPMIFLSSTISDLKIVRSALRDLINNGLRFDVFASESAGASWDSSYDVCCKGLESSDFMILILGPRYGFVPKFKKELFDGRLSVTHAEFRIARQLHKPILVYTCNSTEVEPP